MDVILSQREVDGIERWSISIGFDTDDGETVYFDTLYDLSTAEEAEKIARQFIKMCHNEWYIRLFDKPEPIDGDPYRLLLTG